MHVGIPRIVPALFHVKGAFNLKGQRVLPRLDLNLLAQRLVLKASHDLGIHRANGQVDLAGAVDVRVGHAPGLAVAAHVLEPRHIDVSLVAVRCQIGSVLRAEVDAGSHGLAGIRVLDPHVNPLLAGRCDDLNAHFPLSDLFFFEHVAPADALFDVVPRRDGELTFC